MSVRLSKRFRRVDETGSYTLTDVQSELEKRGRKQTPFRFASWAARGVLEAVHDAGQAEGGFDWFSNVSEQVAARAQLISCMQTELSVELSASLAVSRAGAVALGSTADVAPRAAAKGGKRADAERAGVPASRPSPEAPDKLDRVAQWAAKYESAGASEQPPAHVPLAPHASANANTSEPTSVVDAHATGGVQASPDAGEEEEEEELDESADAIEAARQSFSGLLALLCPSASPALADWADGEDGQPVSLPSGVHILTPGARLRARLLEARDGERFEPPAARPFCSWLVWDGTFPSNLGERGAFNGGPAPFDNGPDNDPAPMHVDGGGGGGDEDDFGVGFGGGGELPAQQPGADGQGEWDVQHQHSRFGFAPGEWPVGHARALAGLDGRDDAPNTQHSRALREEGLSEHAGKRPRHVPLSELDLDRLDLNAALGGVHRHPDDDDDFDRAHERDEPIGQVQMACGAWETVFQQGQRQQQRPNLLSGYDRVVSVLAPRLPQLVLSLKEAKPQGSRSRSAHAADLAKLQLPPFSFARLADVQVASESKKGGSVLGAAAAATSIDRNAADGRLHAITLHLPRLAHRAGNGGGPFDEAIYLFASQAGVPLNLAALVASANEGVNLGSGLSWEGARAESASAALGGAPDAEPGDVMLGLDVGGPDARLGGGLAGGFVDDFAAGDELGRDDQFGHEDDYDHHMHELGSGTPSPPLRHPAPAAADRVANGDEQQQDVFVSPRPAGPAAAARVPKLPGIKELSTSLRRRVVASAQAAPPRAALKVVSAAAPPQPDAVGSAPTASPGSECAGESPADAARRAALCARQLLAACFLATSLNQRQQAAHADGGEGAEEGGQEEGAGSLLTTPRKPPSSSHVTAWLDPSAIGALTLGTQVRLQQAPGLTPQTVELTLDDGSSMRE